MSTLIVISCFLFRFPCKNKQREKHEQWLKACSLGYQAKPRSRICSKHFDRSQFKTFKQVGKPQSRNTLIETAVPINIQAQAGAEYPFNNLQQGAIGI